MPAKWLFPAVVALVAASNLEAASAGPAIDRIEGYVTERNFNEFSDVVTGHISRIVEIRVGIEFHAEDRGGYRTSAGKEGLVLSRTTPDDGGVELLVGKGFAYRHGDYVLDGYYLVKTGGMHQGIASFGLREVDEAAVLLSGAEPARIITLSTPSDGGSGGSEPLRK